jgi:hypothetical protein
MTTLDVDLFLSLPLELQQHIIGQKLSLLCLFYETCHYYRNQLNIVYYNNYRFNPIKTSLINKQNKEFIPISCSLQIKKHTYGYYFLISTYFNFNNEILYKEFILNIHKEVSINNRKSIDYGTKYFYNLNTYYHRLQLKIQCVKVDKKFPLKATLSKLDFFYNFFLKELNESHFHIQIIKMYCYMFMNIIAFNIHHENKSFLLKNIKENKDFLLNDIETMYLKIKSKINTLQ